VLVDGELQVEDGRLVKLDVARLRREADRVLADLVRRSGLDLP